MIELRWVKRLEPAPQYGPDTVVTVKVLQFRHIENVHELTPFWTDWQDVPGDED